MSQNGPLTEDTDTCSDSNGSNSNKEMESQLPDKKYAINRHIFAALLATVVGSALPSGHGLGVINAPQQVIRNWVNATLIIEYNVSLTEDQEVSLWGFIVAIFVAGALIGSFLGTHLADRFGRRNTLLLIHVAFVASGILLLCCIKWDVIELLIFGRLISGIAAGAAMSLMPLYLSEVAAPHLKGVMGTMFPLGLCTGILISQCLGFANALGTEYYWPYLLGGHLIYAVVGLMLHPFTPDSPAYLFIMKSNRLDAHKELCKLRSDNVVAVMEEEKTLIEVAESSLSHRMNVRWKSLLGNASLRHPVVCVVGLNIGQQFVGINSVFFYSTLVFSKEGLGVDECQAATMAAGIANLTMAASAVPLVRYCRRKYLLLVSLILYMLSLFGMMVGLFLIPHSRWGVWVAFAMSFIAVLAYGLGLGPVPYMIGTEIFPAHSRSIGLAIGVASNWAANLLVGLLFPIIQYHLHILSFTIFIVFGIFLAIFIFLIVPETLQVNAVCDNDKRSDESQQ